MKSVEGVDVTCLFVCACVIYFFKFEFRLNFTLFSVVSVVFRSTVRLAFEYRFWVFLKKKNKKKKCSKSALKSLPERLLPRLQFTFAASGGRAKNRLANNRQRTIVKASS